jgi:hypothetical protein
MDSEHLKLKHRVSRLDFSRENTKNSKGLTFENTVGLILGGLKSRYAKEVSEFFNFDLLKSPELIPTAAAFCQPRQKVKSDVFVDLDQDLPSDFYNSNSWESWHDYRLVAIDGSTAHVFDSEENAEFFKGWHGKNGKGELCPKARLSLAYDPLNRLIVDAQISPTSSGENQLAELHMKESSPQDLNIFDRGYLSYRLMKEHERLDLHYCGRVSTSLFTNLTDDFLESEEDDDVVEYIPTHVAELRYKIQGGETGSIKVRLIKITLDSGEVEVLETNVFDKRLRVSSFNKLYHLRWGVEEEFKRLKCRDHLEEFSGTKKEIMMQDFHAAILRLNLSTVISMEARKGLKAEGSKNKYYHATNMSLALGYLAITLRKLRENSTEKEMATLLLNITHSLERSSIPIRPDRVFERVSKPRRAGFSLGYMRAC